MPRFFLGIKNPQTIIFDIGPFFFWNIWIWKISSKWIYKESLGAVHNCLKTFFLTYFLKKTPQLQLFFYVLDKIYIRPNLQWQKWEDILEVIKLLLTLILTYYSPFTLLKKLMRLAVHSLPSSQFLGGTLASCPIQLNIPLPVSHLNGR